VATGNIDAGFFNGNLRANDIIVGNVISGDSYISSAQVKLQDINISGNVISSLTTDLVFSANVTDPNNIIRFDSVSALDIASGTTAQRPPNPDPGYVRYNTDITTVEWWNGTEWTAGSRLIEAETITPDGINQTFTLGQSTLPEGILVNINGTIQQAMSGAYTVAGDQITFSEIPEITDIIEIRYLSAGMTSASWYGGTIVNPVHITAMTPTTSATTGALTVHGGVGFGSNLTIAGNIIPAANTAYSLGDADHWWKSLYVSSNTIYINGIPLSVQADGTLLVNNAPVSASGSTYANSNVAAYLTSQDITGANIGTLFNNNASTQANLGAFQTYANANIGVLYNGNIATNANLGAYQTYANLSIDELQANLGSTQTWANANIASINANVGSFYTWANTNFGTSSYSNANVSAYLVANPQGSTYSNTNVAAYLVANPQGSTYSNTNVEAYIGANIGAYQIWANANAATQATSINSLATGANANTAAYLATATITTTGNITAGNIIISSDTSGNITNVNVISANSLQLNASLTVSGNGTIGTNLFVYGNLQVSGTTTTVNQATLSVTDKIITVANGSTNGTQANGAGLSVAGANANIVYTSVGDQWNSNKPFYATALYDNSVRVVSTSSGAGNLTVAAGAVNLTAVGPGAVTTGSATAIPVITTDAYGRISAITTAAVSSTLNTAGNTGSGTVNLTSQSLTIAGTNGITAVASGQTVTVTDNLWPAANANIGTLFNGNATTNANLGAFQTYANANIGVLFNGNISTNANLGAFQLYANANIGTLFNGNITTNANLGAFQTYANSNAAAQATSINTINANVGAYQIYANANIGTLFNGNISTNANLGAFQLYANANIGTLFNGNISTNANLGAYQTWANANAATQQTSIASLATNANTNTAAYLAAGISTNLTTTGNVSAGNVFVNGALTSYGVVNGSYLFAYNNADQSVGQNGAVNFQITNASNGSLITKTSNSQITLTAGNTYKLKAVIGRLVSSSTWAQFRWYDVTNSAYVGAEGFSEAVNSSGAIGSTNVPTAYVTPSVNTTYELRQTTVNTITVNAYASMEVIQLNPTIAVQATATGTVSATVGNVTLSNSYSQVVAASSPGTTIFTLPTLQPGTYLITARAKYNGGYSVMGIFTGGSQVADTSAFSWYQASGSVNNGLNGTWVLTVTTPTVYTINVWGGGTVQAGSDGAAVANYIKIDSTFALNTLDTMSTTGNVTVGGNLNVTGTSTSLVTKASGLVNAGVDVTLGNLRARMSTGGNRSLQLSTVSGTYSVYGSGVYSYSGIGGATIPNNAPLSITTSPAYINSGYTFATAGATDTWTLMDTSNSIAWRITLIVGASYNNNLITIERLL